MSPHAESRTTRPAALRLTDAERDRLLQYGSTVRAAVRRLLDIADDHERCPAPRRTKTPPPPPPTVRFGPPAPVITYKVDRNDAEPLVTTDRQLAQDTATTHGTRVRRA